MPIICSSPRRRWVSAARTICRARPTAASGTSTVATPVTAGSRSPMPARSSSAPMSFTVLSEKSSTQPMLVASLLRGWLIFITPAARKARASSTCRIQTSTFMEAPLLEAEIALRSQRQPSTRRRIASVFPVHRWHRVAGPGRVVPWLGPLVREDAARRLHGRPPAARGPDRARPGRGGAARAHRRPRAPLPRHAGATGRGVHRARADGGRGVGAARAVADLTPIGCGRDPRRLVQLAERTGLHLIAATGFHRDAHYPAGHWVHAEPEDVLAELLVTDLTEGMDERDWQGPLPRRSAARAGVVKLGASYQRLTPSERRRLAAGAQAAVRTGAPVAVHCETGTFAHELLDLLAEHDLPARRVALAHMDRNPDPGLHAELAERGAFLMYDGAGKVKHHPDSLLIDLVAWMAEAGHAASVLLGGDVGRRGELRAHGGGPGIAHLFAVLVPRLRKALGAELVVQVTIDNPACAFAFEPAAGPHEVRPTGAPGEPAPASGATGEADQ